MKTATLDTLVTDHIHDKKHRIEYNLNTRSVDLDFGGLVDLDRVSQSTAYKSIYSLLYSLKITCFSNWIVIMSQFLQKY